MNSRDFESRCPRPRSEPQPKPRGSRTVGNLFLGERGHIRISVRPPLKHRQTPWRDIVRWLYQAVIAATDEDVDGLRAREASAAVS